MHGFALKAILTSIVALTTTPIGPMAVFAPATPPGDLSTNEGSNTHTRCILTDLYWVSLALSEPQAVSPYFRKRRRPALYQQNDVRLRGA